MELCPRPFAHPFWVRMPSALHTRLQGCVVIFLSNFLALLIKVDAAGDGNRAALGGMLIALNVLLILAVLATSWFTTQQSVDDHREEESSLALAKTMLTFDQHSADSTWLAHDKKEKEKAPSSNLGGDGGDGAAAAAAAGLLRASSRSIGPRPSHGLPDSGGSGGAKSAGGTVVPRARSGSGSQSAGASVSAATVKALWEEGRAGGGGAASTSYS